MHIENLVHYTECNQSRTLLIFVAHKIILLKRNEKIYNYSIVRRNTIHRFVKPWLFFPFVPLWSNAINPRCIVIVAIIVYSKTFYYCCCCCCCCKQHSWNKLLLLLLQGHQLWMSDWNYFINATLPYKQCQDFCNDTDIERFP